MRDGWAGAGELASWSTTGKHAGTARASSGAKRVERWRGRDAVRLGHGPLWRPQPMTEEAFSLEADVAVAGGEGFAGLAFGGRDDQDYELVYVYPEGPDACWLQYEPVMGGSNTWQIYHGPPYQARFPLAATDWVHLRVDIRPGAAAVWAGKGAGDRRAAPQLVCPLLHGRTLGRAGLWGYLAAHAAGMGAGPLHSRPPAPPPAPRHGHIAAWLVAPGVDGQAAPRPARAEANGTLNFNRLFPFARGAVAVASCEVHADRDLAATAAIGYSDCIKLCVNGGVVYRGRWVWAPPQADGRIRANAALVDIRLRPGWNRLVAEVAAEEPPFGWGLALEVAADGRALASRSGA